MFGLIMKIIVCPILLLISDYLLTSVYFTYVYQAIIVGIALAIVGHLMELLLLQRKTVWVNTVLDFLAAFTIIFLSQYVTRGIIITVSGALIVAIAVALIEHFLHLYLVSSGKTKKSG